MKKVCPKCKMRFTEDASYCPEHDTALLPDYENEAIEGRYHVGAMIGCGGMAVVFEGHHLAMERRVAIKVLPTDDPMHIERFRREAKAVSRLNHANIITVYDFGATEAGDLYLAMEFLEGTPLALEVGPNRVLKVRRSLHIIEQVLRALEEAHFAQIVHRDLKPDNIFLLKRDSQDDFVKVLDFGIAKIMGESGGGEVDTLTQAGSACGTPHYMSPEQAMGKEVDARADLYACGVILFEMLCGKRLFEGDSPTHVLSKHVYEAPPRLRTAAPDYNYSPELEQFISQCVAKDPANRFSSATEMREQLERFYNDDLPLFRNPQDLRDSNPTNRSVPLIDGVADSTGERDAINRPPLPSSRRQVGAAVMAGFLLAMVGGIYSKMAGTPPSLDATLAEEPLEDSPIQTLVVVTAPTGAKVQVDGAAVGISPVRMEVLKEQGPYSIRAHLTGYQEGIQDCSGGAEPCLVELEKLELAPAKVKRVDIRPPGRISPHGSSSPKPRPPPKPAKRKPKIELID